MRASSRRVWYARCARWRPPRGSGEHDEAAGPGTDTLPGGEWIYVPLETARGVVGVLGVRAAGGGADACRSSSAQLLEAIARQAAVAIERTRIDVVLDEKARTEAVIEASRTGSWCSIPTGGWST